MKHFTFIENRYSFKLKRHIFVLEYTGGLQVEQKFIRKPIFAFPKWIHGTGSKLTFYMSPILTFAYVISKNGNLQTTDLLHSPLDIIYRLTRRV